MGAQQTTFIGILTHADGSSENVTMIGVASTSAPPEKPDHIWGPTDPRPTPPIANVPGIDNRPPGIWGPTDPRPTPPIYLPDPPVEIPEPPEIIEDPDGIKPPPPGGGWGYSPRYGWGYFPMGSSPGPKK